MDNNTLLLLLVIVLAIVIVAGFFLFRGRSKASLQAGPVSMNFEGASTAGGADSTVATAPTAPAPTPAEPPPPDFEVTNIKAGQDANIKNQAGGRTKVDQVEAKGTVDIERSQQDTTPPKA
ncbi:MAG: hypothetical protein U0X20_12195 [Caldilineaceae bacterium]